jgi:hypothetical protein
MKFDFSRLDVLSASEAGRPFVITNPTTGQPYRLNDEAKTPLAIVLRGRNSAIGRATLRQIGDERAAMEGEGRQPTSEQIDEWNTRYLVAMTVSWNFDCLDGKEFPCNPENAEKLWRDPRFAWLRPRALEFIASDGNFLAG